MSEAKFFICRRCGNLAHLMHDAGVPLMCCGQKMEALAPNAAQASNEKHLPVVTREKDALHVNVGAAQHPMEAAHFIEWVYVKTENGGQHKTLKPGGDPRVTFALGDDKPLAVYAYCNLHGLWQTKL